MDALLIPHPTLCIYLQALQSTYSVDPAGLARAHAQSIQKVRANFEVYVAGLDSANNLLANRAAMVSERCSRADLLCGAVALWRCCQPSRAELGHMRARIICGWVSLIARQITRASMDLLMQALREACKLDMLLVYTSCGWWIV